MYDSIVKLSGLFTDTDKAYFGVFRQNCLPYDLDLQPCRAEAYGQVSRLKRPQGSWKAIVAKTREAEQFAGEEDVAKFAVGVGYAPNTRTRRAGFPPRLRTFGKDQHTLEFLLDNSGVLTTQHLVSEDQEVRRRIEIRRLAEQSFIEADNSQVLRKPALRQT